MYLRAGATPPRRPTLRKITWSIGTSTPCGAPTAPTIPPERVIAKAVVIDSPVPTHSSAASTPSPSVSASTASTAASPLRHDVRRAEFLGDGLAGGVARQGDDPRGAEALRREDRGQTHGAIADDRDGHVRPHTSADGGVIAGAGHVREGKDRAQGLIRVVLARDLDERCRSEWHTDALALAAVEAMVAVGAAVQAVRGPAGAADGARPVAEGERRDHDVADVQVAHIGPDGIDDAHELMADRAYVVGRKAAVVPEVRPADAGQGHADDRVGRLLDDGIRTGADGDVAGAVVDRGTHDQMAFWDRSWVGMGEGNGDAAVGPFRATKGRRYALRRASRRARAARNEGCSTIFTGRRRLPTWSRALSAGRCSPLLSGRSGSVMAHMVGVDGGLRKALV